jgi:hypothetical protein
MKSIEILTSTLGKVETVTIECDRKKMTLTLIMQNGFKKIYTAYDLFVCLGMIRADFPETKFLCKGAKLNVHPSRMSSQMSNGLVAYELELGIPSKEENIVRIFDYEDRDITNDINEQQTYYKNWIISLAQSAPDKP